MDFISILKKCDSLVYFVLRFVIMGDSKEIEKILSDGNPVCVLYVSLPVGGLDLGRYGRR